MARIGDVKPAARYDGMGVGPRLLYSFETQEGVPVDGSSEHLRNLSPFTLRILPPEELVPRETNENVGFGSSQVLQGNVTRQYSTDLITQAAKGNFTPVQQYEALSRTTALGEGVTVADLESFLAAGQFFSQQGVGVYPALQDVYAVVDIAIQLARLIDVPPLTLLINPNNMQTQYTNIQNYSTRTRWGYVFERWGEEQPTISFSGSTGAFIAGAGEAAGTEAIRRTFRGQTNTPTGVQFAAKRNSAAWQNFMSLYHFYRNNGYIYDNYYGSEAHHFVGAIAIDYDQWTYVGHIESFEYTYDENNPHRVEWSMDFRVSRMVDNAESPFVVLPQTSPLPSPSDPRFAAHGRRSTPPPGAEILANLADSVEASTERVGSIPFDLLGS